MSAGVDPAVSRTKFAAEIAAFRAREAVFAKRGWWLISAEFPTALVAVIAMHSDPQIVVFGVLFDFTDYDVLPLSVRLVNPFTRELLTKQQVVKVSPMLRRAPNTEAAALMVELPGHPGPIPAQQVLQGFDDQPPFVCLPGIREYHENAAHTGDSWHLYRDKGVGGLVNILDQLSRFGADHLTGLGFQFHVTMQPNLDGIAA